MPSEAATTLGGDFDLFENPMRLLASAAPAQWAAEGTLEGTPAAAAATAPARPSPPAPCTAPVGRLCQPDGVQQTEEVVLPGDQNARADRRPGTLGGCRKHPLNHHSRTSPQGSITISNLPQVLRLGLGQTCARRAPKFRCLTVRSFGLKLLESFACQIPPGPHIKRAHMHMPHGALGQPSRHMHMHMHMCMY